MFGMDQDGVATDSRVLYKHRQILLSDKAHFAMSMARLSGIVAEFAGSDVTGGT